MKKSLLLYSLYFISMIHSFKLSNRLSQFSRISHLRFSHSVSTSPITHNLDQNYNKEYIFKSSFLRDISSRGYIHQCTDYEELDTLLFNNEESKSKMTLGYLGFDLTAPSLHVGSLLQIMLLRKFQQHGHQPVVLLGGGTTRIGDPSGKDEARQLLSNEVIEKNKESLMKVFEKFLHFQVSSDSSNGAIMVNNADWLNSINYIDFLRDYGRLFSINRMLKFDSVAKRLEREQSLTFLEFNYILLQSFDFVQLSNKLGVQLQFGGSDQWGNIVSGIELGRKLGLPTSLYGMTSPLMSTSDGKKMGKTANGAVWLEKELLSEFDYWQFWRNVDDNDVIRFMKLFTDLPLEEIIKYEGLKYEELNPIKILLADETTRLLHGTEAVERIHMRLNNADDSSVPVFQLKTSDFITDSSIQFYYELNEENNCKKLDEGQETKKNQGNQFIFLFHLFLKSNLINSRSELKKLFKDAIKVNGAKIEDINHKLTEQDFNYNNDKKVLISIGKKKNLMILWPKNES